MAVVASVRDDLAVSVLEDYFDGLDPGSGEVFRRVRDLALEVVPEAEPGTSYGMAALRYRSRPLLGFRAAAHGLSIFPFSPEAVDAVRDRLVGFDLAKGTVRFTTARPLPDDAVRELVRARRAEIDGAG
jgi:uncharacterized protein YdhG (YjbR/CyaY superfamily)